MMIMMVVSKIITIVMTQISSSNDYDDGVHLVMTKIVVAVTDADVD